MGEVLGAGVVRGSVLSGVGLGRGVGVRILGISNFSKISFIFLYEISI